MIKHLLTSISMILTLMTLAACGGGGGSSATVHTTATVKIALDGTLPADTAIIGAVFTLALPANVIPAMTSGAVANNVVTPSGTFAGGFLTPPIYTPATASSAGALQVTLANPTPSGITLLGEVATITLQLSNGAAPTASSFNLDTAGVNVIDALGNPISGVKAVVSGVQLH